MWDGKRPLRAYLSYFIEISAGFIEISAGARA
jgi:hypothetical protein